MKYLSYDRNKKHDLHLPYPQRISTFQTCIAEFIPGRAYFGALPSTPLYEELIHQHKVTFIINLLPLEEQRYCQRFIKSTFDISSKKCKFLRFPIRDHDVPFSEIELKQLLGSILAWWFSSKSNERLFIHCRGGHGRSALIASILLFILFPCLSPSKILHHITSCHHSRKGMRQKYYKIQCPHSITQKYYFHHFTQKYSVLWSSQKKSQNSMSLFCCQLLNWYTLWKEKTQVSISAQLLQYRLSDYKSS